MTPLQKQYVEKLEELILVYNNQFECFTEKGDFVVEILKDEIASLEQQIEKEKIFDHEVPDHDYQ